jgi:hypothetical protein
MTDGLGGCTGRHDLRNRRGSNLAGPRSVCFRQATSNAQVPSFQNLFASGPPTAMNRARSRRKPRRAGNRQLSLRGSPQTLAHPVTKWLVEVMGHGTYSPIYLPHRCVTVWSPRVLPGTAQMVTKS